MKFWLDEIFFLVYHMPGMGGFEQVLRVPVYLRKEIIHRFIEQKEKEHKQIEADRKRAKGKK